MTKLWIVLGALFVALLIVSPGVAAIPEGQASCFCLPRIEPVKQGEFSRMLITVFKAGLPGISVAYRPTPNRARFLVSPPTIRKMSSMRILRQNWR